MKNVRACVCSDPSIHAEGDHTHEDTSSSEPAPRGKQPSMTAPSHGAAVEGEDDPLFDAPLSPEEVCPGLLRLAPPSISDDCIASAVRDHAIQHPKTIRSFIRGKAEELAKSACEHELPLVTWQEDPNTTTCGLHQGGVLSAVSLKVCVCVADYCCRDRLRPALQHYHVCVQAQTTG